MDMNPKNPQNEQNSKPEELVYQVMPGGPVDSSGLTQPNNPNPSIPPVPAPTSETVTEHQLIPNTEHKPLRNKVVYIVVGIIVLAALGALAYYMLGPSSEEEKKQEEQQNSRLPKAKLMEYFGIEICHDANLCGDEADPDSDGLSNYKEFIAGTNLTKSDSDEDGLADGDEVNIFKTDPTDKFTDPRPEAQINNYNDGLGFVNGFDPLTPGFRLTETRKKQLSDDVAEHGLHEPSKTTLKVNASGIVIAGSNSSTGTGGNQPAAVAGKQISLMITANNFPSTTIAVGDTVTWTNQDSRDHQIASDPHPAHTDLPGLVSETLGKDKAYSFTFTKAGNYGYHDHLNSSIKGVITVK